MKPALIFLLASFGVHAATMTVTGPDMSRGGLVSFLEDGNEATGFAGILLARYDGQAIQPFFCADLFTPIDINTYTSQAYYVRPERGEDRVGYLFVNYLAGVTTEALGQAMQLAIWDILHDGADGPDVGRIRSAVGTPAGVVSAWSNYLAVSAGQSNPNTSVFINYLGNTNAQTLIGAFEPTSINAPEPATFALVGASLLALGLARRRTRR
jgi:PEP-CTERM motif